MQYQINAGDTFWIVSTTKLQNLKQYQAVERVNPTLVPTNLGIGQIDMFPAACSPPFPAACPLRLSPQTGRLPPNADGAWSREGVGSNTRLPNKFFLIFTINSLAMVNASPSKTKKKKSCTDIQTRSFLGTG
ncbi:hypothetical protein OsI_20181 [Oryza sativa Indica Group]|uniref:NFP second LysM domain-containing protein n=1 Tax=Oryza sativa subsp. indica TaxID=39946 RepID=B8AYT3_ORYSI|nr:hypothetical protein OsI_20181 [Oryza sativa Indica Group]